VLADSRQPHPVQAALAGNGTVIAECPGGMMYAVSLAEPSALAI